jgi:hypothetical protein
MFDNHTPRNTSMQRDFAHDGAHNIPNDGTRQGTHIDGSPPHVNVHNVPEPSMLSLLIIAAVVSLIVASVRQWRNRPRPTENLFKRNGETAGTSERPGYQSLLTAARVPPRENPRVGKKHQGEPLETVNAMIERRAREAKRLREL